MNIKILMISEVGSANVAQVELDGKVVRLEGWQFPPATLQTVKEQKLIEMAKERLTAYEH